MPFRRKEEFQTYSSGGILISNIAFTIFSPRIGYKILKSSIKDPQMTNNFSFDIVFFEQQHNIQN